MVVALNWNGSIPVLIDISLPIRSFAVVPLTSVNERQPVHEPRQIISFWPEDEMPVVRHDAIGKETDVEFPESHRQDAFELEIVCWFEEQTASTRRSIQDMEYDSSRLVQRAPWHRREQTIEATRMPLPRCFWI